MTAFQHPGLGLRTGLQETAAGPGPTVRIETPKTPARRTRKGREKAQFGEVACPELGGGGI